MAKNLKIKDLKQQQQIKALSDEELLEELGVMVVRDAKSLTQILHLLRNPENKSQLSDPDRYRGTGQAC